MLTFDEASHRYYLGEVELPSVSRILQPLTNYPERDPGELKPAMEWGTQVHKATELYDALCFRGETFDPMPEDIGRCVEAWSGALDKLGARVTHSELRVYHPKYLYAGTLDRIVTINEKRALIDIKTGGFHPWYDVQLAAYAEAWEQHNEKIDSLFLVNLRSDGSFAFKEINPKEREEAFISFRAALHVYRQRQKWGIE